MKSLFLKQSKPHTIPVLGGVILVFTLVLLAEGKAGFGQILTMTAIGVVLLGYDISYEICKNLKHKWHFQLFGFTIIRKKLALFIPDYLVVFSALFKKDADWGPVAALGNKAKNGTYVIRLFKGNKHFTIWKPKSLKLTKEKALMAGKLLDVEVKIKKQ